MSIDCRIDDKRKHAETTIFTCLLSPLMLMSPSQTHRSDSRSSPPPTALIPVGHAGCIKDRRTAVPAIYNVTSVAVETATSIVRQVHNMCMACAGMSTDFRCMADAGEDLCCNAGQQCSGPEGYGPGGAGTVPAWTCWGSPTPTPTPTPTPPPPTPPTPAPPGQFALHSQDSDLNHCHELQVFDNTTDCFRSYWGAHGYQFAGFKAGLCPKTFDHVDEENAICQGPKPAYARIKGILPPPPPTSVQASATSGPLSVGPQGCSPLGGQCTGSEGNPQGSCCNNAFCKYYQPDPAGRVCMGCYSCKCAHGGPGSTDDPQKCLDDNGKLCPSTKNC